jgi:hypothetical protein
MPVRYLVRESGKHELHVPTSSQRQQRARWWKRLQKRLRRNALRGSLKR